MHRGADDRGLAPVEYLGGAQRNASARIMVPRLPAGANVATFLIMGQSLGANWGGLVDAGDGLANYVPGREVYNFDNGTGLMYRARDPLLAANGNGASPHTRMGDKLIAATTLTHVVLANIAIGGTAVGDWAPASAGGSGGLNANIGITLRKMRNLSLPDPTIIWDQGVADSGVTAPATYVTRLQAVIATVRAHGGNGKVVIARQAFPNGSGADRAALIAAQMSLVNNVSIFEGANADALPPVPYRTSDGVHWSATGLDAYADDWALRVRLALGL